MLDKFAGEEKGSRIAWGYLEVIVVGDVGELAAPPNPPADTHFQDHIDKG
jgi:hypothetical protein